MKLWIDDIRQAPDDTWQVARTVTEAIRMLHTAPMAFTEISIDHDISYDMGSALGKSYVISSPENFTAVAYVIASMPFRKTPKITIHSSNPDGSKEIQRILRDGGIIAEYIPA